VKELAKILQEWERRRDQALALATLVRAQGSSYRRVGARMLIASDGTTAGSLSAGCLEEEVAACALRVIHTRQPTMMSFDTRRRFGCDGSIEIFVEPAAEKFLAELARHFLLRHSCIIATVFEDAERLGSFISTLDYAKAGTLCQMVEPPLRLIVVGDEPELPSLETFVRTLGWQIINCQSICELPNEIDSRTAALIKTHHYGRDCAALRLLLPMGLRYLGLIGPRRRRDRILGDVLDSGVEMRSQLFAPAGLDLGAEAPEEVAMSVVAEIQRVFGQGSGESLRDRRAPIHCARQKSHLASAEIVRG
jgi:xanthine dehydrogenase accessory factor